MGDRWKVLPGANICAMFQRDVLYFPNVTRGDMMDNMFTYQLLLMCDVIFMLLRDMLQLEIPYTIINGMLRDFINLS